MNGDYFRVQVKRSLPTYNGDPWQFVTGLGSMDFSKSIFDSFRSIYPGNTYRIVEHITDEIYDVVPETEANA